MFKKEIFYAKIISRSIFVIIFHQSKLYIRIFLTWCTILWTIKLHPINFFLNCFSYCGGFFKYISKCSWLNLWPLTLKKSLKSSFLRMRCVKFVHCWSFRNFYFFTFCLFSELHYVKSKKRKIYRWTIYATEFNLWGILDRFLQLNNFFPVRLF